MSSLKKYPRAGMLLIAEPMLMDPNFKRTVILMCEHNREGSFGLVLNKMLDLTISDVLEDPFPANKDLFLGGPVQPDTLHIVHKANDIIQGNLPLLEGVYWGGNFEAIKNMLMVMPSRISDFRFFLGYSGWGPGQLEAEIESGGWVLTEATEEIIFSEDSEKAWRTIMKQLGGEYALFSNVPDDPSMN